jgi:diacylglycerol kinase family enzyme
MNAEFLGDWDVAPRGHPNDGRAEVVEVDASMRIRDRLAARGRLRAGAHLPHPDISTRSIRSASWTFERPMQVIVDGHGLGRAREITLRVVPDAATVYA